MIQIPLFDPRLLPPNPRPDPLMPPGLEAQRLAAIRRLGARWLLHPANGPARGRYSFDGWPAPVGRP